MKATLAFSFLFVFAAGPALSAECAWKQAAVFRHAEIGVIPLLRYHEDPATTAFYSQMQVNPDGAPDAYDSKNQGTVHICNGVNVGKSCVWQSQCMPEFRQALLEEFNGPTRICFFAMVTDSRGRPVVQGADDPKPGYYISTTSLHQPGKDVRRPEGQLDANVVPSAVIPGNWKGRSDRPGLGDFGVAYRPSTGKVAYFVVGDTGPRNKLGEGSIALHQSLGNDPFMMRYGVRRAYRNIPKSKGVVYLVFHGSADPSLTLTAESIEQVAKRRLDEMGGEEEFIRCAAEVVAR